MSEALVARAARRRWSARARHSVTALVIATLLGACEGGSGQSGSAFVFLTVDGFSLGGGATPAFVSSVPSSTAQGTTTIACVTLRNNLKNPTVTAGTALDNVTVRSYTVTITPLTGGSLGGPFTFGTAVLVPAGTVATGVVSNNTATFAVVLVPSGSKGSAGTAATVEITFRGRDGRGQAVETDGAVTVLFTSGLQSDSSCSGTTGGTGGTGGTGTGGTTT
jgi:hypothetical protein